ncbi:MAG TPA: ATP-binding protein [Ramlibacter sp.]|uniref:hybrid sensor histidine kinase/response regulator n=1 Tax=Ramlibacter sp. TaxID=1917967 RepID=UPI002D7FFFF0|nr:ATP-binding protein [Ramlibacter sp.]HET8744488.1 ATP-binding protein [Ramlibacter sp.]
MKPSTIHRGAVAQAPAARCPPGSEYQALFDATDEGFCILQMLFDAAGVPVDGFFLQANPSFERQSGLRGVIGRHMSELPMAGDEEHWLRVFGGVARTGHAVHMSDRSEPLGRWFDVHAFRIGDPAQALVAVRFSDITHRRRVEERLGSVRRIRTVGVLFWGEDFRLVDVNDGFVEMSGYPREEAIGLRWQQLTPPEFHSVSRDAVQQVLQLGETTPYEKQYIRKDGTRWWGLFAARRIGDEVVEFVLDVTDRKRAEEALRQADRHKDQFLATLAHELRNPLAPIRNGLQILRLSLPREAEAPLRTIAMMNRQLDHLVRLVDDLLDVARIGAGKVRIEREVVSLREVLARSVEATQAAIDARRHRLDVDLRCDDCNVEGDSDRLAQVFSNLLSNAAKYTPPGGRIRLELSAEGEEAVVSVSDTGMGIPKEQQERIFELFSQVGDHERHAEGGLGIGLSLVQSLVRLHGGSVQVESEGAGKGCRFTVRLPRAAAPLQDARADAEAPVPARPCRILIADDNADAADSLAMLLEAEGHAVATALDGAQAVERVQEFQPDVAFLDLGMPVMGGLEAARRIRGLPAGGRVRLVALTGWSQASDRERTRAAGFDLHLVKPLTARALQEALVQLRAS